MISATKKLQLWNLDPLTELTGPREPTEPAAGWTSTTFSLRGDRLAAVDAVGDIHLWTVEGWIEHPSISAKAGWVLFGRDGDALLTFGPKDEFTLWRIATGEPMGAFRGHSGVTTASVSPDGRLLATGSKDTTVRLWDLATRSELATLVGGAGEIHSVAFSRDGKTVAAGSYEGVIQLWNVASGQQVGTLQGHISFVNSLAFSPDGSTLASSSVDKTLRLWKAATREEISRPASSAR